MFRLALMLLGIVAVRRAWRVLAIAGAAWGLLGVAVFIDGLDGRPNFPERTMGGLLLLEGLIAFWSALSGIGLASRYRLARGIALIALSVLIIVPWHDSEVLMAMLFGALYLADGALRVAAARVLRFPGWQGVQVGGLLEVALAIFVLEPWPTWYHGTLPYVIGTGLVLSGWALLRLAWRVRALPPAEGGALLLGARHPVPLGPSLVVAEDGPAESHSLVVHVWTALGAAKDPQRRPLIDRYIAAVDANGTISTGHAALEMPPQLYLSLYPAADIERSPDQFASTLKATAENDVPAKYQPSYALESAEWCPSTRRVVFRVFNARQLRLFAAAYRQEQVYNLTRRNCSSTVAYGLDSALAGVLGGDGRFWRPLLRLLLIPELWVAAQLRVRAETMAWTPGLVLDYARALRYVVQPRPCTGAWRAFLRRRRRRAPRHAAAAQAG